MDEEVTTPIVHHREVRSGRWRQVPLVVLPLIAASTISACLDTKASPAPARGPRVSHAPTSSPEDQANVLLRFAVIGDWGAGTEAENEVAARMCRRRESHPFDLVITAGDNLYETGDPEYFESRFFTPMACLLDAGVRFRSTLGNHDMVTDNGRPELDEPAFGMKKRNYVVRKSGVRFVLADSNNLKMDWLRRATKAEEGDRWTVVAFHHPVFSQQDPYHTFDMRPKVPRLFRRRDVDLVLNGHEHIYAVTVLKKGIRYVVTGGGGASIRACKRHGYTDVCKVRHHFLTVVATDDHLKVKAVPARGKLIDRFKTEGR